MSNRHQRLKQLTALEQDLRKHALPTMTGRSDIAAELQQVEQELREVASGYEQYFMGIEKFEPAKERQILALRLRRLLNCYIPQTDLRFRLQGLASRLHSYAAYWDRILRQIEEGRYERQRTHTRRAERLRPGELQEEMPPPSVTDPLDRVYRELVEAYVSCRMAPPRREQVDEFIRRQAEVIRDRFGEQPVEMMVVVEDGKPKLRVRSRG